MSVQTAPAPRTTPPDIDVCHYARDGATRAYCGAHVGDEPGCCDNGHPPCGRPPCPLCDLVRGLR